MEERTRRDLVGSVALIVCGALMWGCTGHREEAVPAPLEFSAVAQIETLVAGRDVTCTLIGAGWGRCWGRGYESVRHFERDEREVYAVQLAVGAAPLRANEAEPWCYLEHSGTLRCDFAVPALGSVSDIAIGYAHACAVLPETVDCWNISESEPIATPLDVSDAIEVAVAREHACALKRSGQVVCWSLVDGDCGPKWIAGFSVGVDISARVDTCVVDVAGDVRCLGPTACPSAVVSGPTIAGTSFPGLRSVATGYTTNCAAADFGVDCWPVSEKPEGEPDSTRLSVPVGFADEQAARGIAVGSQHACVDRQDGVACWGSNLHHQLDGFDHPIVVAAPRRVHNLDGVTEVIVGSEQSCARKATGAVYCWGSRMEAEGPWSGTPTLIEWLDGADLLQDNKNGQIGALLGGHSIEWLRSNTHDAHTDQFGPTVLSNSPDRVDRLDSWDWQLVCGLSSTRAPMCAAFTEGKRKPTTAPRVLAGVRDMAMCGDHIWTIDAAGAVSMGFPDRATILSKYVSYSIDLPAPAMRIACRRSDVCALLEDGSVACWGDALTKNFSMYGSKPLAIPLERPAAGLVMGFHRGCTWRHDGRVECWQRSYEDEPDDVIEGTHVELPTVLPGVEDAVHVSLEFQHGCVLHAGGEVSCWGSNSVGQVGVGSGEWRRDPVAIKLTPYD